MKRFIQVAAVAGWFFVLAVPKHFFAVQVGPMATQGDCEAAAAMFTTEPGSGLPVTANPFYIRGAVTTACWEG
jgi:hypothetical protein